MRAESEGKWCRQDREVGHKKPFWEGEEEKFGMKRRKEEATRELKERGRGVGGERVTSKGGDSKC